MRASAEKPTAAGKAAEGVAQEERRNANFAFPPSHFQARCACCGEQIRGATSALIGVHFFCWLEAGERIRRVHRSAVERRLQAEQRSWVAALEAEEARMAAEVAP